MKRVFGSILALILGGLVGFFGVFVSVFADGSLTERLITIIYILIIYGLLGTTWGYTAPYFSWKWGFSWFSWYAYLTIIYV